jgi:hypothetical protein
MCKNLFIVLIATCLLLVQGNLNAQTGLNFQGVARSSNNTILASQPISIRLSILQGSTSGNVEYTEIRKLNTNAQGLFTAVIGDSDAISSIGNFNTINWKNTPKFLKIEMDANAGNNFTTIGITQFQYVAYAQFANSVNAENIAGIVPIEKGGTGVTNIASLKSSLELDKIVNTTDLTNGLSLKADKVEGKVLSSNDYTNAEKTKLAAIVGTNTGDQDLSSYATVTALALKANSEDINSSLLLKANTVDLNNGLSIKENSSNKSNAIDLGGANPSDILFPTQKAVKQYVAANSAAGGVADGGISTIKLADGAVTYSKFQSLSANTILGNSSSSTASMQAIATTGSNNVVLSNSPTISSPTLITPDIGNAIASSINNVSINTLNGTASITVRGETLLRGNNNGDDAPNQRYESLLTDGIVSLNTDQPISGKKTFFNDIQMGNIGGIGSTSPTTINFANGSKLGDVQNINEGSPDNVGSIDLYAPDGAKWVQLNYNNIHYMGIESAGIFIDYNNYQWKFGYEEDGSLTKFPGSLVLGGLGYNASIKTNPGVDLDISSPTSISINSNALTFSSSSLLIGANQAYFEFEDDLVQFIFPNNGNYWKFWGDDGSTFMPGELNIMHGDIDIHQGNINLREGNLIINNVQGISGDVLTIDNTTGLPIWKAPANIGVGITSINNISSGSQSLTVGTDGADFNITSVSGLHTFNLPDANITNRGLLNSADYTRFNNKQDALDFATSNRGGYLRSSDFNIFNNKQDALTNPSSDLFWDASNKRLGIRNNNPSYPFEINQGADNYGFMLNAPSSNTWGSTIGFQSNVGVGNITNTGLFQLDGDGAMVFRNYQNQMYFDNFDVNGMINFRIGGEYGTKRGMSINNQGNLYVDGTISSAGTVLTSDIRLKKNILPLNRALTMIKELNPVSYQKKQTIESDNYSINENGFIAQELQKVLPMLVHESTDKEKLLSVNYTAIIPILTKGIQEQQDQIEELKKEMKILKKLMLDLNKKK